VANALRIGVLVVDDHALVRDGLKRVIADQPDMVVVGEASNGGEAVAEAQRHMPLILLLDVSMPGSDGIAVAQTLNATCPEVRVIAVTRHTDDVFVAKMFRAGAAGYVLKQSPTAELLRAIRAVAAGNQYTDSALRVAAAPRASSMYSADVAALLEPLTPGEEQVLQLLAHAYSNQEIARQLRLDSQTVADLKTAAMRKAGLETRLDVMSYATRRGWS
jgi:DNA-binding NarL/FixJ family response regulator